MLFDSIGKIIFGAHQNSLANQIHPEYHPYQVSPYSKSQLGLAQQLFNGRMFGAADQEKNIAASQAQYMNNAQRNATDSGQLLALGGLAQGQSNNAYQNLQTQESQNKYDLLGNLNAGYRAMTQEGDKVYQDQLQKYQIDTEQQAGLRNAGWQNIFSGFGDFASGGLQAGQMLAGNPTGSMGAKNGSNFSSIPSSTDESGASSGGGMNLMQLLPLFL